MGTLPVLLLAVTIPDLSQLQKMLARFAPTELQADTAALSPGDRAALAKLVAASQVLDDIFLTQRWAGNHMLYARLQKDATPLGKARLRYFRLNKGPWSDIDDHQAFLPDVPPRKPPGSNFYPEDLTRQEFEQWVATLSIPERPQAEGFFTVIRRNGADKLTMSPYSREYRPELERAAGLLREAAAATGNTSLKRFLTLRAEAFLSNDYYSSDVAWMDLDSPVDITIGPYETYNDKLFGYKAAFEAYVNVRDEGESARLTSFAGRLQEIEDHLPIDPKYRNPRLGAMAPITVVNEVFAAGDAAHGVQTAAYNLPNDERVVHEKGSKRVMLKNVQEAKFQKTLVPIAARVLAPEAQPDLNFEAFFTHILAHELSHGIGPHQIRVAGRGTTPRQELKELYSAIEEAKADVTGLFMLQHLYGHGMPAGPRAERRLYSTYLASSFRSLRFGLTEAHGKGMAVQFNYLWDKGAIVARPDGRFEVDFAKIQPAVRELAHDLLTLEAEGNYAGAKAVLENLGVVRPEMQRALNGLQDIPVDIAPVFAVK
jgi:hypothetical protein